MNSLYKQAYLTSIGFTKFITGIHYLIELLAFNHVIEPFDIESLQPYVPNKELLMILTSKSLTLSATTYFRSSLIEVLQDIINELQRRQNPISDTENAKKELERLYTLLEEADDQEDVIIKLEHTLKDAMNDNNFEKVKELHLKLEEVKLKDRFYIQNKIDELEPQLNLANSISKNENSLKDDQLISLTKLIEMIADKDDHKILRKNFRQWLVDNDYIVEVNDGISTYYSITKKGDFNGIIAKTYISKNYKSTGLFIKQSFAFKLVNTFKAKKL